MIDRDQVKHVARLARLRLTDEEIDAMVEELPAILGHIERMESLDLEGVEPTTHVVHIENVLREDVPRPSLPRGDGARAGARPAPERLRGSEPGAHVSSDLLDLTAAEAGARVRDGELSAGELFDFWRGRAAADDLGSYLWVADRTPPDPEPGSALGGVPVAVKDLFCVEGVPSMAASRILEGYRPPYTATAVERLAAAGAPVLGKTNQDEFAMGSSTENSAFGPVRNPWDRERVPGGSSGGSAAAVAGGTAPWAIGTDTGGSIRQPAALCGIVGHEAHLRRGVPLRDDRLRLLARPVRAAHPHRDRRRAAAQGAWRGTDPNDSTSLEHPAGIALPSAERLDGMRVGSWGLDEEGLAPGVAEQVRRAVALVEELGGSVEPVELPHAGHGLSAYYVIAPAEASSNLARYDGVRYGHRTPERRPAGDVRAHPPRRLRRGGPAPDHDRHLRPLVGLLRGLLRHRPEGAHADRGGLQGGVRAGGPRGHAHLAHGGLQARRAHRGPARDVPVGLLHGARVAGRAAGDLDPASGSPTACPWVSRSWGRPSARAASSTPRTRSRARSASRGRRAA